MTDLNISEWPCPALGGGTRDELVLVIDRGRPVRLLVLPAWFDEANKLRRFTVEVMRRLDLSGIDCVLPDLPGANESTARFEDQTLQSWREAADAAACHFRATRTLAVRAAALIAPPDLPGWGYAAIGGRQVLRSLLRARSIAAKEAGRQESPEELQTNARREGIELAGWRIGAEMFSALETAETAAGLAPIEQAELGGAGLWLRAEPDESPTQADALAAAIATGIAAT